MAFQKDFNSMYNCDKYNDEYASCINATIEAPGNHEKAIGYNLTKEDESLENATLTLTATIICLILPLRTLILKCKTEV